MVNVPIGLTAIICVLRLLPESRAHLADRLDPLGMVLLSMHACGSVTFGGALVRGDRHQKPPF